MRTAGLWLLCSVVLLSQDAPANPLVEIVRSALPFGRLDPRANMAAEVARRVIDLQHYTLGAAKRLPRTEHAVAFRPDGAVLWVLEGTRQAVVIPGDKDVDLNGPGSSLIFVHNHPSGGSMSSRDLGQLAKPGIAAIVILGHDGSIYIAGRGPRFDALRIEGPLYGAAREGIAMRLRLERPARVVLKTVDHHVEHLAAVALSETGVIEYWALLSPRRKDTYRACGRFCDALTEAAEGNIKNILDAPKPRRGSKGQP